MARIQRLVNVVDVLNEITSSVELPPVKTSVDHVHHMVFVTELGHWNVGKYVRDDILQDANVSKQKFGEVLVDNGF